MTQLSVPTLDPMVEFKPCDGLCTGPGVYLKEKKKIFTIARGEKDHKNYNAGRFVGNADQKTVE